MMRAFPYTVVTLVIYNIVIIFSGPETWDNVILTLNLFSDVAWPLTTGMMMIVGGLVILLVEILRATTIDRRAITNHIFSIVVLLIYVIEFVVVGEADNSTFFILTLIALVDVLGGIVVTIRLATRDFSVEHGAGGYPTVDHGPMN
jgi:hypothetical protein